MTGTRSPAAAQRVRTHVVVGDCDEVRSALDRAHRDGRLAGVRNLVELPNERIQVTADLREPARVQRRWPWLVLVWALGIAAAAGIAWLLVLLISAVVAFVTAAVGWVSTHLPVIVLGGVALLLLALPAGSRCVGVHCGGCRR